MVKGVTRRVVVVRCPETKYFDEAIFMVRENALEEANQEKVLKEACRVADEYIRQNAEPRKTPKKWILGACGILGAAFLCLLILIM